MGLIHGWFARRWESTASALKLASKWHPVHGLHALGTLVREDGLFDSACNGSGGWLWPLAQAGHYDLEDTGLV